MLLHTQSVKTTVPILERRSVDGGINLTASKDARVSRPRAVEVASTAVRTKLAQPFYATVLFLSSRVLLQEASIEEAEKEERVALEDEAVVVGVESSKEEQQQLGSIIQWIHNHHVEMMQLSRQILTQTHELYELSEKEKNLKSLLDKCSEASHDLWKRNTDKEQKIIDLKNKLQDLRNQLSPSIIVKDPSLVHQ